MTPPIGWVALSGLGMWAAFATQGGARASLALGWLADGPLGRMRGCTIASSDEMEQITDALAALLKIG